MPGSEHWMQNSKIPYKLLSAKHTATCSCSAAISAILSTVIISANLSTVITHSKIE